ENAPSIRLDRIDDTVAIAQDRAAPRPPRIATIAIESDSGLGRPGGQGYPCGMEHESVESAAHQHRRRLLAALAISGGILITGLVAGWAANSLALLAEAGHMFADLVGMSLSLAAIVIAN